MVTCYMIVTPDPRSTSSLYSQNSTSVTYYVKFGDGNGRPVYQRANPDHAYEENTLAPSQALNVVTYDASTAARLPGKWLEWVHVKITGHAQVYAGTEWHTLTATQPQNNAALRANLVTMLSLFGQWNRWEEQGIVNNPTSRFEDLVDKTWNPHDERSVARFVR
ncbi:hypothetical protein BKA66DRAFT_574689 [Pyrenochaeta sp. MPI-SDFR-AT-0127]|nr:hypothetical protein BKA66DRAFT_574689 [Pyrenochaeta sp. MPI-SDFR-AT-0127]